MHITGVPTLRETLTHDWTRRFFRALPEDPLLEEHLDHPSVVPGTSLDLILDDPDGLPDTILAARDAEASPGRLRLWRGPRRIREETLQGWFGPRFRRIQSQSFRLLLERTTHFFILQPRAEPVYLFPLPQFARFGLSVGALESVLDARVLIPQEALYARNAYVPSLRVFASYDGNRYGDSTRKLFYSRHGTAAPVESVAREVLERLGYAAVSPAVLHRLFLALTDRPPSHFHPSAWPLQFAGARSSPLGIVDRARGRLRPFQEQADPLLLVRALEAFARRPPFRGVPAPDGALPLVARYFTRRRLEQFLEAVAAPRLGRIFEGFLRGHRVVSADWFAYQEATRRAFACEVKSRGDHLQPSQKESILYCQRAGGLEYRLLEVLHNLAPPRKEARPAPEGPFLWRGS